jgi:DUF4097 and DUF4098 domain-containing protein YvlB
MDFRRLCKLAVATASCTAFPLLSTACVVVNNGCSGWNHAQSDTVSRTATVEGGTKLVVETRNGRLTAKQDDAATTMQISAQVRCSAPTQEEADQRVKDAALVATKESDGTVRVSVKFPPLKSGDAYGPSDSASVEVRAASLSEIDLRTSNGRIEVTGFDATLKGHTSNGQISLERVAGAIDVQTSNGSVHAKQIGAPAIIETSNGSVEAELAPGKTGAVEIRTSNGSVTLELPAGWNGTLDADTSNGKVTIEAPGAKSVTTERGHGSAVLGTGEGAKAKIRSSNGSVKVKAAAPAK